jgi:hypothetical protein
MREAIYMINVAPELEKKNRTKKAVPGPPISSLPYRLITQATEIPRKTNTQLTHLISRAFT